MRPRWTRPVRTCVRVVFDDHATGGGGGKRKIPEPKEPITGLLLIEIPHSHFCYRLFAPVRRMDSGVALPPLLFTGGQPHYTFSGLTC